MKFILLLITLLFIAQGIRAEHKTSVVSNPIIAYGTSTDFQFYNHKEVFVDIDYSDLGLT